MPRGGARCASATVSTRFCQAVDIPAAARQAVLSRIKVVAGMDISVQVIPTCELVNGEIVNDI